MATSVQPNAPARQAHVRRPSTIDLQRQPPARPHDRASRRRAAARSASRPSAPARQRQRRLPVPHRRVERGVLRCRKIGGIRDQRVERSPAPAAGTGRRARGRRGRRSAPGSRSPARARRRDRSIADDLIVPALGGEAQRDAAACRCRRRPPGRRARGPAPARPALRSPGRGISARRSLRSVRWRKPVRPVTWASGSPAARRRTASAKASARSARDGASSGGDERRRRALAGELGPEPERLAPRRRRRRRRASAAAPSAISARATAPASDAILLLPARHAQRLDQLVEIAR